MNGIWIETQNKKQLLMVTAFSFNNIKNRYGETYYIIDGHTGAVLGSYDTHERVLEVFKEIRQAIIDSNTTFYNYYSYHDPKPGMMINCTSSAKVIYEMPKE